MGVYVPVMEGMKVASQKKDPERSRTHKRLRKVMRCEHDDVTYSTMQK